MARVVDCRPIVRALFLPISAGMRTRVALVILFGFILFSAISGVAFGWYGYRIDTELTPGSWRAPTEILDRNGSTIVSLYGSEWRVAEPVTLSELPDYVPNAFLAAEDTRFRSHFGIDPIGIGRAAAANLAAGGVTEGGSTITQQLAKMRFLSPQRTMRRKFMEFGLAPLIEIRLSKDEILEAYLNEIYLGHRDGREVRGLGEAARVYFGKTPKNLTVAEAALIAGMIRAPNRDNPDEHARIAKQRRDAVLGVMLDKKWVSRDQHDQAVAADAEFKPGSRRLRPHPYLIAAIREEFIERLGRGRLYTGGLKIHTSVDTRMQVVAEAAIRSGTQNLRRSHGWLQRSKPLQGALLSVEPATGGIRALVGGSDFRRSQYDRTRLMRRQPGSAAKPFTYAAAIASRGITPATVIEDAPVEIRLASNQVWRPKNYDQQFRGPVTVREAFEKSLNVPAVRVAQLVGVDRVRDVLSSAGFPGDLSQTPAIALGVDDISMRELVGAYSIFPNLGVRIEPHVIETVDTRNDKEIYRYEEKRTRALDPAVAYVMHTMLRGVVLRGTAASLNQYGLGYVAGKTGTTNNYRDAWFIGYTPDLLTAVWVGFDDGTPLRMSSAQAAVPIWATYVARAPHMRADIRPPAGVTMVEIEAATGRLWELGCGPSVVEAFVSGTEPRERCGGYFEGSLVLGPFEEPPMLTDEELAEWARSMSALHEGEIVKDPDLSGMAEPADTAADVDSVEVTRQLDEAARQLEEQRQRDRLQVPVTPLPAPPPPVVLPPPPPPPPTDTIDSLSIRAR
jgi:penicillin-binding protein 1B